MVAAPDRRRAARARRAGRRRGRGGVARGRAGARAVPDGRGRRGPPGAQPARHGARGGVERRRRARAARRHPLAGAAQELVLRESSTLRRHAFPLELDGDDGFSVRVPAARVPSLAGELPLAEGTWELFTRARDGNRVPVMLDAALHARLPAETVVALKPFSLAHDARRPRRARRSPRPRERGARPVPDPPAARRGVRRWADRAAARGRRLRELPRAPVLRQPARDPRGARAPRRAAGAPVDGPRRPVPRAGHRHRGARRQPRPVGGDGARPLHRGQRPLPGVVRPPARADVPADLARHAAQAARVRRLRGVRADAALRAPVGGAGRQLAVRALAQPLHDPDPAPRLRRRGRDARGRLPAQRRARPVQRRRGAAPPARDPGGRAGGALRADLPRPDCATIAAATGSTCSSTSSACAPPPGRTRSCCTASTTTSSIPCP